MALKDLPDNEFERIVNEDLRDGTTPDLHAALRNADNIERWIVSLKRMKRSMEYQLVSNKATKASKRTTKMSDEDWLLFVAEKERWRANTIRVKTSVENRLDEATALKKTKLNELVEAIWRHKRHILFAEEDADTTAYDEELWSVVDDY